MAVESGAEVETVSGARREPRSVGGGGGGGGRNIRDPDSLAFVLSHIDNAVQYGDDIEPREPEDAAPQDDD